MKVTIHLPDDIAQRVQVRWQDVPRHALESFVLEGFRARVMTTEDVRRLLGVETKFALVQSMLARDAARKRPMSRPVRAYSSWSLACNRGSGPLADTF